MRLAAPAPVLELAGVSKSYPGVRAVDRADLHVLPGEVHALVGENGAGKSTLIKILAGVVRPDAGALRVRGREITLRSAHDALAHGLSFIHQELNLVPYLNGAENIFLGRAYPRRALGLIDWPGLHARAAAIAEQLGASVDLRLPVGRLSRGEQALVAIARAFAEAAAVVVMDEPTAALSASEAEQLFRVVGNLRAQGAAVLYVSHRLDEIFALADRVTVMRNGHVVATSPVADTSQPTLIEQMIGRPLEQAFPPRMSAPGGPLLEVEDLAGGPVRGASFALRAGEVLGVGGLVGAGRSELLRLMFGAEPRSAGAMRLAGQPFAPGSPAEAIRRGLALVPEERRTQGLLLGRSIGENLLLPHLAAHAAGGWWRRRDSEARAGEQAARAVHLSPGGLGRPAGLLSGGNQQKVVFGRWLTRPPLVLLLDEPTRGIDVGARYEIYRVVRELAAAGVGIVMVSSDWQELLGMADRVLIMRDGGLAADLPAADLTQELALRYCYGTIT